MRAEVRDRTEEFHDGLPLDLPVRTDLKPESGQPCDLDAQKIRHSTLGQMFWQMDECTPDVTSELRRRIDNEA